MSEYTPNKLHDRLLTECLDNSQNLSDKQVELINSFSDQLEIRPLSKKQASILNSINQQAMFR